MKRQEELDELEFAEEAEVEDVVEEMSTNLQVKNTDANRRQSIMNLPNLA
jgi:hypothetical protein